MRISYPLSALTTACLLASAASAQLSNSSFEAAGGSLQSWQTFNNGIPNVISSTAQARTGATSAKVFGGFNGSPNFSGMTQNRATTAGETVEATAFVRHASGDSLAGTSNRLALKIEFYRVPNGSYGTADMLGEHEVTVLDGASPLDTWIPGAVVATAPPQTVEARLALVFVQVNNQGGAAFVDDVQLAPTTPPGPGTAYELIWADEFDGNAIDASRWRVEDIHLIKNNELQCYTPEDVWVADGKLTLRSQERFFQGFDQNGQFRSFNYTSGLVESKDRFATVYGRIEVAAKLPGTQGIWPAHWMLPDSREWPPEIDIMELLGHDPDRVYMTHHWGQWPNVQSNGGSFIGPDFTAGFHEFAVEWSPNRIDWFVDGALRFSSTATIPTEPFYVILNTAVGGDWPGAPNGSTVFPQLHEIDYVRVYVPADPGPALQDIVDTDAGGATADGVIGPGEYAGSVTGINTGLFDRIGAATTLHVDSDAQGGLQFAIESTTAWPNDAFTTVIYIDAIDAQGFTSTYALDDTSASAQRATSGKGNTGQRSDLYFASGFRADYALVLQYGAARLFELGEASHTLLNGADLGAATDMLGGTDMRYVVDDGSSGGRVREVAMPLALLSLLPGESFRFFATVTHAQTAFRANEFIGVAAGNGFDAGNPGAATVVLKPGDFVLFSSVDACAGDVDGSGSIDLADLAGLLAAFGAEEGDAGYVPAADLNSDGSVDLSDLAGFLAVFGSSCS